MPKTLSAARIEAMIGLDIETTVDEIAGSLERDISSVRPLLRKFVTAFNSEFPRSKSKKIGDRAGALAITWAGLGGPLALYSVGLNGPAIVDLHGILERFAFRDLCSMIATNKPEWVELNRLMEGRGLRELAQSLGNLKIWDKEDVKFAERLTTLRNGAAHKNPRLISNLLCSGKKMHFLDVDAALSKADVVPLILSTSRLLLKLARASLKRHITKKVRGRGVKRYRRPGGRPKEMNALSGRFRKVL